MKRVQYQEYGGAEVMTLDNTPLPKMADDEVLIAVKAFSLNEIDWKVRSGSLRVVTGFSFPRGMGADLAGVVEKAGSQVDDLREGDEVVGWLDFKHAGSYAEYAVVKAENVVKKPASVPFAEAACLPMVGATARQALLREAKLKAGQTVLINGCTGGLGHYAVQIAKQQGAIVTGTCRSEHREAAQQLGVDDVVDYTQHDIRQYGKTYDVILDTSKHLPFTEAKLLLNSPGIYLNTQPGIPAFIGSFFNNLVSNKKNDVLGVTVQREDLLDLTERAAQQKLLTTIGKTFVFSDVIAAVTAAEQGELHVPGKIVVTLDPDV
ncbi:NAD(P)-dependent alcohol dehydrogenase [Tunicatimonas pelagia]|uniref:NAD(P)-dependent alcohol dehydrogenase n=1 Tax=Tunicatimonas pelagia TaxID=931531 RepID=UPI002666C43E|nr:NAD(P)-dependent alcohol dehydrogenase [Tunicatimonas pelagia]WKN42772.1 NAD(P)-dependent alcohol dehydrogenase [Tunicatimonas pelagia]